MEEFAGVTSVVMRFGSSTYLARYHVTDEAITILRIWHGLEDRPK